jgi:hypothetical protein
VADLSQFCVDEADVETIAVEHGLTADVDIGCDDEMASVVAFDDGRSVPDGFRDGPCQRLPRRSSHLGYE